MKQNYQFLSANYNFGTLDPLGLWNVVQFPNKECVTNDDAVTSGICMKASECTDSGGQMSGNCASGFGICCSKV